MHKLFNYCILPLLFLVFLNACNSKDSTEKKSAKTEEANQPLFTFVTPNQSGIKFMNQLPEDKYRNIVMYQYYYNGGGVAVGDINNDGLSDLFFTGNLVPNRLYINKGNFKFEDITQSAGIAPAGKASWCTGVSLCDINQDGFLDIYVCRSGNFRPENRTNLLYINNQNNTFTEQAEAYGLNDPGYSIQSAFFDYDKDGDMDMFLLNHGMRYYGKNPVVSNDRRDPYIGDKLFRNDQGKFTDISAQAGIKGNSFGYGLGLGIADLNQDGWEDVYVANDFFENDYLYFNQQGKGFKESIKEATQQTSFFGMGVDLADYNNDGLTDIFVLDMTAEDHYRNKANLAGISEEKFYDLLNKGYHYQYMFNSLNLNNGNGTFSNIARLAGIDKTDWSWSPLLIDLDNDGFKDLFITNGLRKDILNLDYIDFMSGELARYKTGFEQLPDETAKEILGKIPSERVSNYVFKNNGDLTFSNETENWGVYNPGFSNGAVYADLDNDGDQDLILNNIDAPISLYRNDVQQKVPQRYLQIKLKGPEGNLLGIGTKVSLIAGDQTQFQQYQPVHGYQSSMATPLHFGLGESQKANMLTVTWPDGNVQRLTDVESNQLIEVAYSPDAFIRNLDPPQTDTKWFSSRPLSGAQYRHQETNFNDFNRERLLPHKLSTLGPALCAGDVNNDGLDDIYLGGAKGFSGKLFLQTSSGTFNPAPQNPWQADNASEDVDALFVDIDQDGDLDLYVVSGGNEAASDDPTYQDRLYVNDGSGGFSKSSDLLPKMLTSGACVRAADFDQDGDQDLFVGGRLTPGKYPAPGVSYLLKNNNGQFEDITQAAASELSAIGMVTDAVWMDINEDKQLDLILCGEWMPITIFTQQGGKFAKSTDNGLDASQGWWFSLHQADIDQDGDLDLVAGNMGLNYRYATHPEAPFELYAHDFDDNGALDIVFGYTFNGNLYPTQERNNLFEQMTFIKQKYPEYANFARATLKDIFGEDQLNNAEYHYQANTFASAYIENLGQGKFSLRSLPTAAQVSPLQDMLIEDINQDGHLDIIAAGNFYGIEVQTPRMDAGIGVVLLGDGKGNFSPRTATESGFYAPGDVRKLVMVNAGSKKEVVVGRNGASLLRFGLNPPTP